MDTKNNNDATYQKILLVGATGFTGQRVLKELSTRPDVHVTCLLRPGRTLPDVPEGMTVNIVRGDLENETSLKVAMAGKDGMIYVASLGFGHAETVVKCAEEAGLSKCVFTSTTAIFTKLAAPSKKVRKAAEECIMSSKLNWTIIRPTMIYGRKGDRNMERLVQYLRKIPILFVPGSGTSLQQPNFVDDVAEALVASYFSPHTSRKAYNISGRDALNFKQVVETIGDLLDKKVWVVPIPLEPCLAVLRFYERLVPKPLFKSEQLLRLNENKAFPHLEAVQDFGYHPRTFAEGAQSLIKELKGD